MSFLPPLDIQPAPELVSSSERAVEPGETVPSVVVVPQGRSGRTRNKIQRRPPASAAGHDFGRIEPTKERRQHFQEVVEETITLHEAVTQRGYDPVARENIVVEVLPAVTAKTSRIRSPLDTLGKDIGPRERQAAKRYAEEFESAGRGMRCVSIESSRGGTGGVPEGISETQVRNISSIREVRAALGVCAEVRLRLLLIEQLSFSAMAALIAPGRKRANEELRAQAVFLLMQLAEHYRARRG